MKYLLDTDHISILQRQTGAEYVRLKSRIAQHSQIDLAFSIISFHEQILGCHTYINRARNSNNIVKGYDMFARVLRVFTISPVISFDNTAASVFDELLSQKVRVATMDLRIASIALSRDMVLVTRNLSDFVKVPDLKIEDWTEL
ncbi:MAG: type II toxin-antitoxin system VapC family toxin [Candidatus Latescibacteria bacterium]|nr:type II toxin-antitoxin system VapC family toxin [Candidatus Latescibacterota bacterium]